MGCWMQKPASRTPQGTVPYIEPSIAAGCGLQNRVKLSFLDSIHVQSYTHFFWMTTPIFIKLHSPRAANQHDQIQYPLKLALCKYEARAGIAIHVDQILSLQLPSILGRVRQLAYWAAPEYM